MYVCDAYKVFRLNWLHHRGTCCSFPPIKTKDVESVLLTIYACLRMAWDKFRSIIKILCQSNNEIWLNSPCFITFTNLLSLFNVFYNSLNYCINLFVQMLRCNNNVSASLAGVTLMCLECIWKKLSCTESSSQFRTFYYCCTIYTSTYNFECINFHIIFLFVCLSERVVWK